MRQHFLQVMDCDATWVGFGWLRPRSDEHLKGWKLYLLLGLYVVVAFALGLSAYLFCWGVLRTSDFIAWRASWILSVGFMVFGVAWQLLAAWYWNLRADELKAGGIALDTFGRQTPASTPWHGLNQNLLQGSCLERSETRWPRWGMWLFCVGFIYYLTQTRIVRAISIDIKPTTDRLTEAFCAWLGHDANLAHLSWSNVADGGLLTGYLLVGIMVGSLLFVAVRKLPNLHRTFEVQRLFVRYDLALQLIPYGTSKLFLAQFPKPTGPMLDARLGDLAPSQLMWSFFGTSDAFNLIAGSVEILAGVSLLFRRTTLFGATLSLAILSFIATMDFCYGVLVAVHATTLAILAFWLLAPDLPRLYAAFFGTSSLPVMHQRPLFANRGLWWLTRAQKLIILAAFLVPLCIFDFKRGAFGENTYIRDMLARENAKALQSQSEPASGQIQQ